MSAHLKDAGHFSTENLYVKHQVLSEFGVDSMLSFFKCFFKNQATAINASEVNINEVQGDQNHAGGDIVGRDKVTNVVDNSRTIHAKNYIEGDVNGGNVAGEKIEIHHQEIHHHAGKTQKSVEAVIRELDHLPKPSAPLIGRKVELDLLDAAFKNPKTRIATIIAAGGVGKSALTVKWLDELAAQHYFDVPIQRVFAWLFYSQGQHQTFTNSSAFFQEVFKWLKVKSKKIPKEDYLKGRLLARLLDESNLLLVLDGLEPLQQVSSVGGALLDSGLLEFLAQLQHKQQGFVLLSSRQKLVELGSWEDGRYCCLSLATLTQDEGAALLERLQVDGSLQQRQALSADLGGHALSLVLCGRLLVQFHQGDIRYAKELPSLADEALNDGQARRVLQYYDGLLDEDYIN